MKVFFTHRFNDQVRSLGAEWVPRVTALQKRIEAMDRTEFWADSSKYKVPNLQDEIVVFRLGNLRLFALANVGEQYAQDLVAFLEAKTKDEVAKSRSKGG